MLVNYWYDYRLLLIFLCNEGKSREKHSKVKHVQIYHIEHSSALSHQLDESTQL